ncbi:MAG TPA: DinB family protein [Frankiaceae bacterium]|jgi:uncharacterized damage-inducible protein DinB|nr:DinB family protein [Frankiaceae bacterium]
MVLIEWTAPGVERRQTPDVAGEREMLERSLDFHRATLLMKCAGLTGDELRRRPVSWSKLSLLGLVRHMAEVERSWFQRRLAGRDVTLLYCDLETNPDGEFDDVATADPQADFAVFAREVEQSRAVSADRALDDTFFHERRRAELSLRWLYVHMIEEYARHNGHADLLREGIDGATGE